MGGGNGIEETRVGAEPNTKTFGAGRYLARQLLGEGGQKIVYLVHDTALNRECAFSLIKTDLFAPEELARFRREAQLIASLGSQPHIVTVFDIGEEAGRPYVVSEYVSGGDLRRELRAAGGPLPIERALNVGQDIARGLSVAHRRGIVHRDIKPDNVWLTEDGRAKLGDFGLALALDRSSRLTMVGTVGGTAAYMAPEQALGIAVDARTDLYSLGCVLYEMVCARPPFAADGPLALLSQHIHTPPVPPSERNPDVPPSLERLILQLLSKDREVRPSSADELIAQLDVAAPRSGPAARTLSAPVPAGDQLVATAAAPPAPPPSPPSTPAGGWQSGWGVWKFVLLAALSAVVVATTAIGLFLVLSRRSDGGSPAAVVQGEPSSTIVAAAAASPVPLAPFAVTAPATPDTIAYVGTDGNLWIIRPDGTGKQQLTSHGEAAHPAWSPDGRLLVYVHHGDEPEVWVLNVSTKEEQVALRAISYESGAQTMFASIRSPVWTADGKAILYYEQRGESAPGRIRRHVLSANDVTADSDTTVVDPTQMFTGSSQHLVLGGFDLSPAGDRLTFEVCDTDPSAGGCGIFTRSSIGTETPASVVPIATGEFYGLPAFAPNGGQIAYYAYPGTPQNFLEVATIESLSRQRLAEAYPTTVKQDPYWPKIAWSPDGKQIYYETLESGSQRALIMVQDLAGGAPRTLVEGRHPAWVQ